MNEVYSLRPKTCNFWTKNKVLSYIFFRDQIKISMCSLFWCEKFQEKKKRIEVLYLLIQNLHVFSQGTIVLGREEYTRIGTAKTSRERQTSKSNEKQQLEQKNKRRKEKNYLRIICNTQISGRINRHRQISGLTVRKSKDLFQPNFYRERNQREGKEAAGSFWREITRVSSIEELLERDYQGFWREITSVGFAMGEKREDFRERV